MVESSSVEFDFWERRCRETGSGCSEEDARQYCELRDDKGDIHLFVCLVEGPDRSGMERGT